MAAPRGNAGLPGSARNDGAARDACRGIPFNHQNPLRLIYESSSNFSEENML
jgi:hypothetical protein